MHPALSIIAFTTLSALGYGLAAVLGMGFLDPSAIATKLAHLTALGLIGAGLMSSTLHLGNPQRAWRAFSQWRSSWLSREAVMAVITFVPLTISAAASIFANRYLPVAGILGALLAAGTVYCTSMIYASLRSVDAWHTWLTPTCFLLFAAAGGLLSAVFFALAGGGTPGVLALFAAIAVIAAWGAKLAWWRRLATLAPSSSPESATGLGHIGKVSLFERPHVNDNYLTREMGFRVARKHADKLRTIVLGLGASIPGLILAVLLLLVVDSSVAATLAAGIATLSYTAGILVERWLFFAQARHAVMNYYGG